MSDRADVVIVAGGRASRMGPLAADLPKCLLPVGDRPVLDHQRDATAPLRAIRTVVAAGHLGGAIARHVAGTAIEVHVEARPRGSGGAVRDALGGPVTRDVVVLLGDVVLNTDLVSMLDAHRASGAAATVLVHPNDHPFDSDLVELDHRGLVIALHPKPHPPGVDRQNLVVAGAYVLSPAAITSIPRDRPSDLSQDVIGGLVRAGCPVQGHRSFGYAKDMGTPARYERVRADWASGTIAARAPGVRRPGVILDRDGTLIRAAGLVTSPDQVDLAPETAAAIAACNRDGVLIAVATNQSVLARGLVDDAGLRRIHDRIEARLANAGAWIDAWFVCPHHPDGGYPEEVPSLKRVCDCRKPAPGLVHRALRSLPLDPTRTVMLGDQPSDVEAGRRAGIAARLVADPRAADASRPSVAAAVDEWRRRVGETAVR